MIFLLAACIAEPTIKDSVNPAEDVEHTDGDGDGFTVDDCDDDDDAVNPTAVEICNGLDDDCDGAVDEEVQTTTWADTDGDGFGDPESPKVACEGTEGRVTNANDCDDLDPEISPAAAEVCNDLDDDCDDLIDEDGTSPFYADADADGYGDAGSVVYSCTTPDGYVPDATDCDDTTAAANPDGTEVCDLIDNDCDDVVDEEVTLSWYVDLDADGFGTPDRTEDACGQPTGYAASDDDCDDTDASVNPGATEVCDGVDQDCDTVVDDGFDSDGDGTPDCVDPEMCDGVDNDGDGVVDEADAADATVWYIDYDGDGYGSSRYTMTQCDAPAGYVGNADDCDDNEASVSPGAAEVCNGSDDDCDGTADDGLPLTDWYADADGDGYGDTAAATTDCTAPAGYLAVDGDCDDGDSAVNPGAGELCNGVDDDCDGTVDDGFAYTTWYADADGDAYGDSSISAIDCIAPAGYLAVDGDCDDGDDTINPAATETCDGVDEDCDGTVDDGFAYTPWYADADGDAYGDSSISAIDCVAPAGYLAVDGDCDDGDSAVNPGAGELCNGVDDDCDGIVDDGFAYTTWYADADGDAYGDSSISAIDCVAPAGYLAVDGDCDDGDDTINPAATETCDGVDEDCDGTADDGLPLTDWYADDDGDGYGDSSTWTTDCIAPASYVAIDGDCDDTDATVQVCSSCLDLLYAGSSVGDGVYSIDPCGTGAADYYCDMTTDGGGWTVAGWQASNGTAPLGVSDWGTVGSGDWSTDLACVPYEEIMVSNETYALHYSDVYTASTFSATAGEFTIGSSTDAFVQGWYGPGGYTMACVNLTGSAPPGLGCDNDWIGGQQGHVTDYAGEFCSGGRLDSTWAWATGSTCMYRGGTYTWSWALR